MACMTSVTTAIYSYEEPICTTSSSTSSSNSECFRRQRRRHSSYHARSRSVDSDNLQQLMSRFLTELDRRLAFLEEYGQLHIDKSIERAYSTLKTVSDSCSHVSDEVIGAGLRRAKIIVDTLETHYNDALARKETMEQKVQEGVRFMEQLLTDFESRAYAVRDSRLAAANQFFGESKRRVDSGLVRARDAVDGGLAKARQARDRAKSVLSSKVERARELARHHGLISYDDLPEPWRVNRHILKGYRFPETKLDCLRSVIAPSNELVNIWSHALGCVLVLGIAFYYYPATSAFSTSSLADLVVAGLFFFAAVEALACSSLWHIMSHISCQSDMEVFACFDYTGISLLIASTIMIVEYAAFYCEPVSRWTYMIATASLGVFGTVVPWHPFFNKPDGSWMRVAFFISLASTGCLPFLQTGYARGFGWALDFYMPVIKSLAVYAGGAVLYASQVPERWFPGMFDYFGGSHNIWHVAVLGAIILQYSAMQELFGQAFDRAAQGSCSIY